MVDVGGSGLVFEDSSGVVQEFSSDGHTASDRSSQEFVHHALFSTNCSEFIDSVDLRSLLGEASFIGHAVSAFDLFVALNSIVVTSGLIYRAGLVGDVVFVDPFEGGDGVSSVASVIRAFARNKDLRGYVNIRPLSVSHDLYAITHCRRSSLGPARSAIDGDVLVLNEGQEIGVINIIPSHLSGELINGEV